ncbi:MAG: TlyA family RNA methyltransferase [Proteobacteria bacterium]|jgi:23S rRNA (cytidine1920-2'-O)/16S rRNA (cytidine1409-2'-O)-methyltransferase|nr:TlyA family RNA methyltransferase [Pseudomonadota bacterium]
MSKVRIDVYLAEKGFVPSRTKAQDIIRDGLVQLTEGERTWTVKSPSELISDELTPKITIQKSVHDKYVSRAGLKVEGALTHLKFSVEGLTVLDVGISTGGFSDCLLQNGAQRILGVDVGHNQLNYRLKNHPRLQLLEGVNARTLEKNADVLRAMPNGGFQMAVIDVSFISLRLVLPSVLHLVKPWGHVLALVKPQFEVGAENLDRNGIVKESSLYQKLENQMRAFALEQKVIVKDYFQSSIEGKDGNTEFFIFLQKS